MMPSQNTAAAVIGFENRRAQKAPLREPKSLLERVYTEGSLLVRADDRSARTVAAMLGRLGFLILDEIGPEGDVRRLTPAETSLGSKNPWRVSKPDLSRLGQDGVPDPGLA
jgi:hypothetical protein